MFQNRDTASAEDSSAEYNCTGLETAMNSATKERRNPSKKNKISVPINKANEKIIKTQRLQYMKGAKVGKLQTRDYNQTGLR